MRIARKTRRIAALAAAMVVTGLGACSANDDGSNDTAERAVGDGAAVAPAAPVPDAADDERNAARDSAGGETAGDDLAQTVELESLAGTDLIRTAQVSIVEKDLEAARESIDELLRKYGGTVADEKTIADDEGSTATSRLVVRVPARSFSDVMDDLKEALDVRTSVTKTEDVHTEVIDVESRLANLRVSLARLRAFLRDASDLNAMLQFEQRITNVESQIASLAAQREYLNDQTTMSTITIDLRTPSAPPPKPEEEDPLEGAGFGSGLANGWDALTDVLVVAATVVGAVIPFGVVGAVIGVPLWWALRRRRRVSAPEVEPVT